MHQKTNMIQVTYKNNQGNKTATQKENDTWVNKSCPKWICDFSKTSTIEEDKNIEPIWPNGEVVMYCLNTRTIIPPSIDIEDDKKQEEENRLEFEARIELGAKMAHLNFFKKSIDRLSLVELGDMLREDNFEDDEHKKALTTLFISKLPKFSSAAIAKMKEEKNRANKKFYTWEKGVKASSTSHTAWGHRRNGGGKGKKTKATPMDTSAAALALKAAAKRIRQTANKEKAVIDMEKRKIAIERVEAYKKSIAEESQVEEPVEIVREETEEEKIHRERLEDYNEFKRKELESVRLKVIDISYEKKSEEVFEKQNNTQGWNIVDKKKLKQEKVAAGIVQSLYAKSNSKDDTPCKSLVKVEWTKAKKATLMCRSVTNGKKCPHPPGKCNFAHTPEELNPKKCANRSCRFVKFRGDAYVNEGKKVCAYQHEGETKRNLCSRIGVKMKEVICKPVTMSNTVIRANLITPTSDRVLKPYSKTRAWGPVV